MGTLNTIIAQAKQQDKEVIPQKTTKKLNVIIQKRQLKRDLAAFLHGALYSPCASTLLKAIKKIFLTSFPGLTETLAKKHLPTSMATELGHLRQEKQHLQSTTNNIPAHDDFFWNKKRKQKMLFLLLLLIQRKTLRQQISLGVFHTGQAEETNTL